MNVLLGDAGCVGKQAKNPGKHVLVFSMERCRGRVHGTHGVDMRVSGRIKTQVQGVFAAADGICREYAAAGSRREMGLEGTDWSREREKLKEMLLPFVKEAVKKQLREEREYYRSRPSLAIKQAENIFGLRDFEDSLARGVTGRVYGQIEERVRREWVRKGEG